METTVATAEYVAAGGLERAASIQSTQKYGSFERRKSQDGELVRVKSGSLGSVAVESKIGVS